MHDRQRFISRRLANGITLHVFTFAFPISCFELLLPAGAGHAHAGNGFLPGSSHFLEHTQLLRTQAHPEAYSLDRLIGLRGGHSNGTTYPTSTHFEIDVPSKHSRFGWETMVERTFQPLFHEQDLIAERTVVMNERDARRFYPGRSEASRTYHTEFLNDAEYPLEQLFGSDENLQALTSGMLEQMQQSISFSEDIHVLAVGPGDFAELAAHLERIQTKPTDFSLQVNTVTWADPTYRALYYDTVAQPTLEVAWNHPRVEYQEFRTLSLLISLLVNPTHGALHQRYREELGWTYGLEGYAQQRPYNTVVGLSFPVNSIAQVDQIRGELAEKIDQAVHDQALVECEVNRYLSSQVYNYQTSSDVIGGASYDLDTYGRIHPEEEWYEAVKQALDPVWRTGIAAKYLNPAEMGSICFMPERRKLVPIRDV